VVETGAFRSDPNIAQINAKITKADTDNTIAYTQYQIKAAADKAFFVSRLWDSIASGATADLCIENPSGSGRTIHIMVAKISTTDQAWVRYIIDPTLNGGTQLTPVPFKVGSSATSVANVIVDVDSYTGGTEVGTEVIPGGSGNKAVGGMDEGLVAFVIPEGHKVLFEVVNKSSNANQVSMRIDWWEE